MPMIPGDVTATTGLASEIRTLIKANCPSFTDNDEFKAFCFALASALITHVTTNGLVMPTALVAPAGGGAVSGTGSLT